MRSDTSLPTKSRCVEVSVFVPHRQNYIELVCNTAVHAPRAVIETLLQLGIAIIDNAAKDKKNEINMRHILEKSPSYSVTLRDWADKHREDPASCESLKDLFIARLRSSIPFSHFESSLPLQVWLKNDLEAVEF